MNEIELIGVKIQALFDADDRLVEMELSGQITLQVRDAWLTENEDKRDRLAARRATLRDTGSGVTPLVSPEQAANLRAAVRKLQEHNVTEAAIRAILGEILTIAEAVAQPASVLKPTSAARALVQTSFRNFFNVPKVVERKATTVAIRANNRAVAHQPASETARGASVQREGAFVTPQSLVTFAGASTFISLAWKVSGQIVKGWDENRSVALAIAVVVGLVIYLISETDPERGSVSTRDRIIGIVIALFNTIVLFSATVGLGEIV